MGHNICTNINICNDTLLDGPTTDEKNYIEKPNE